MVSRHVTIAALGALLALWSPVAAKSETARVEATQPNFLIILTDDMGYSDIGAFGSEIETPNLDSVAKRGVRLTNLHVAPICAPTRAMLLTGNDPHMVGLGTMDGIPMPEPRPKGYEGYLTEETTLASKLRQAGYTTLMTGKWHLGSKPGYLPGDRGFDHSFVLHQGGGSHYGIDQMGGWAGTALGTTYSLDDEPATMPVGTYTADTFTNRMIGFLKDQQATGKPFFAYLAFTEPHWPLQAPAALIDRFEGRYDAGPFVLQAERLERMKTLGLVPTDAMAPPIGGPTWEDRTPAEREIYARYMEIYAAMVTSIDENVGRVLDELRAQGRLDNTVIVFMSDNGASGSDNEEVQTILKAMGLPSDLQDEIARNNQDPEKAGGPDSYLAYGRQWGEAAMTPYRLHKGFTTEGGIRAPAFISGPGIAGARENGAMLSVRDVMPTFLQLAGVPAGDAMVEGGGRSWVPMLRGVADEVRAPDDVLVTEQFGRRMVLRNDGWKAVFHAPGLTGLVGLDVGEDSRWELYNMREDPSELHDRAESDPEKLQELLVVWERYSRANNLLGIVPRMPARAPDH